MYGQLAKLSSTMSRESDIGTPLSCELTAILLKSLKRGIAASGARRYSCDYSSLSTDSMFSSRLSNQKIWSSIRNLLHHLVSLDINSPRCASERSFVDFLNVPRVPITSCATLKPPSRFGRYSNQFLAAGLNLWLRQPIKETIANVVRSISIGQLSPTKQLTFSVVLLYTFSGLLKNWKCWSALTFPSSRKGLNATIVSQNLPFFC